MPRAYIALGSNSGDRIAYLRQAIDHIRQLAVSERLRTSSIYTTEALTADGSSAPDFLNAVCELRTELTPPDLLQRLQAIEDRMGRRRLARWASRTIDLDLLDYAGQTWETAGLRLPHPCLSRRDFVLQPLLEIAPGWRHPVSARAVGALLEALADSQQGGKVLGCCGSF